MFSHWIFNEYILVCIYVFIVLVLFCSYSGLPYLPSDVRHDLSSMETFRVTFSGWSVRYICDLYINGRYLASWFVIPRRWLQGVMQQLMFVPPLRIIRFPLVEFWSCVQLAILSRHACASLWCNVWVGAVLLHTLGRRGWRWIILIHGLGCWCVFHFRRLCCLSDISFFIPLDGTWFYYFIWLIISLLYCL